MYSVPLPIPIQCNKCPFGMCFYNNPSSDEEFTSRIDGKKTSYAHMGMYAILILRKKGDIQKLCAEHVI